MKYFAYGSNLDQMQMAQRCPGARLLGPAQLADHRLCFPRRSPVRECAVASIEPHRGHTIWGVVYELDEHDARRLDEREGYDPVNQLALNRYCRIDVSVTRTSGGRVDAYAYVAVPEDNPGRPSMEYLQHIIDGAIAHSFPGDYVEMLKAVALLGELALPHASDVAQETAEIAGQDASPVEPAGHDEDANTGDQPAADTGRRHGEADGQGRQAVSADSRWPVPDDRPSEGDG